MVAHSPAGHDPLRWEHQSDRPEGLICASSASPRELEVPEIAPGDRKAAAYIEETARLQSAAHVRFKEMFPAGFGAVPPNDLHYVPCDPLEIIPLLRLEVRKKMKFLDLECGAGLAVACARHVGFEPATGITRSHAQSRAASRVCELTADHFNYKSGTVVHMLDNGMGIEVFPVAPDPAPERIFFFCRIGSLASSTPASKRSLLDQVMSAPHHSLFMIHKSFDPAVFGESPEFPHAELMQRFGPPLRIYHHRDDYTFSAVYQIEHTAV